MKEHWFLISEDELLDTLKRAYNYESPDALIMELWSKGPHYDDPTDDELFNANDDAPVVTFSLTREEN